MSHKDAENYLNEMTQANNNHASEFRVMAVSMEKVIMNTLVRFFLENYHSVCVKVLNNIQSKKQSRKMGRYDMDLIYRIQVIYFMDILLSSNFTLWVSLPLNNSFMLKKLREKVPLVNIQFRCLLRRD